MCRNIRTLHNFEPPATRDEIHAAALQFVRKISGSAKPSVTNAEAFDRSTTESAVISPPKSDSVETSLAAAATGLRMSTAALPLSAPTLTAEPSAG